MASSVGSGASDPIIAELMALGFDYFVVKRCVEGGFAPTLESGANWILQQTGVNAVEDSASSGPVLALGNARSASRPASAPPFSEPVTLPSFPNKEDASSSSMPAALVEEPHAESRLKTSRKDYVDLATVQALERAKKLKRAQVDSRSAIKQQIAEDRQTMRDRKQRVEQIPLPAPSVAPPPVTSPASLSAQTIIQFRLPSNRTVKITMPTSTPLEELFARVAEECQTHGEALPGDFTLLQAFPRRVFARNDASGTLLDAGMVPSATLNVIRSAAPAFQAPIPVPVNENAMDVDSAEDSDDSPAGISPERVHVLPTPVANWNRRGVGHRLSDMPVAQPVPMDVDPPAHAAPETDDDDTGDEHDSGDEESEDEDENAHQGRGTLPRVWGTGGHRLTDGPMLGSAPTTGPATSAVPRPARKVRHSAAPTLKQLCINTIEPLLTRANPDHLRTLSLLPPALGELLVAALKLNGRLTVQSLGRLGAIRMQSLDLSNYRNVADSWCESVTRKWWFSLERLRLGGCDLLTDKAIGALEGMTCLEDIDLEGCRITDGGITYLAALPTLRQLSLARTKITSLGLTRLSAALPHLQSLNITQCTVGSPRLLSILSQFSELLTLNAQRITFHATEPHITIDPGNMRPLQEIDLTASGLSDNDLIVMSKLWTELQVIRIGECPQITATGLEAAIGNLKALTHIQLPSRDLDVTGILPLLFDRPLVRLDLAACTVLPPSLSGIEKLADTLTYLDLSGTSLTDAHLSTFTALTALTYLSLDRTAITDAAITNLLPLSLQTLALTSTSVTSASVQALSEAPDMARSLVALDLQRTRVCDDCLPYLRKFINLETLNFSNTKVTKVAAAAATKPLARLRILRLVGCEDLPEP
ncbi:hypothetical protein HDU87_008546 [Geranomyces variabilis]|uniref:UBX domain-containing protein n=1 Tax=Geranomyces variabilis TaxID=109894 RepID=A0AAD5TTR1_9FUNG|nr:hypothetical protein HDU87_008546 [Geranomyces variabilis]